MPTKKRTRTKPALQKLATASVLLLAGTPLFADTLGLNTAPLGNHTNPFVKYAVFDTFNQTEVTPLPSRTYTFSGNADVNSTLTGLSLIQSSAHVVNADNPGQAQGAGLLNGGDVYYASTKAQSWTLTATSAVEANTISFQIKIANINNEPTSADPNNVKTLFKPTLAGFGEATYVSHIASGGPKLFGFDPYVVEYRWTGISVPANTPLSITFGLPASSAALLSRKPVDFVALDVTNAPVGGSFTVAQPIVFTGTPLVATFADWQDSGPLNYSVFTVVDGNETQIVAPGTSATPTLPLGVGSYTVRGKITDAQGNTTVTADRTVRVLATDKKAPAVTIAKTTASPSTTLTGTVTEDVALASFKATLNGNPLTFDEAVGTGALNKAVWTISDVLPQNGPNTLVVEATDYAGKISRVTQAFTFVHPDLASRAGTYNAILNPSSTGTVDTTGLVTITVTSAGGFTGKVTVGGVAVSISGYLQNDGVARFKPTLGTSFDLIDKTEFDSYLGALSLTVNSSKQLVGTLSTQATGGTTLGNFTSVAAPYNKSFTVPVELLNQPVSAPVKGVYSVALPSKTQDPVVSANLYPQGAGYVTATIANTGSVTFTGYLADGTKLSGGTKLNVDGTAPIFAQLYKKRGAFAGVLKFDHIPANTDVTGSNLLWVRPEQPRARYYPAGWALKLDAIGTKYAAPASVSFGQSAADPVHGNASLIFSAGGLTGSIIKAVSINPGPTTPGQVKLVPALTPNYKFSLTSTGAFSGTITHDNVTDSYRGTILNKGTTQVGYGYFLSTPTIGYNITGEAGNVSLLPTLLP